MRPARILLLLVAIVAGGLAAFLATRGSAPVTVVEQAAAPAPKPSTEVLVAKQAVGVGQRLTPGDVEWQPWPDNAVRAEYITIAKSPDANTKIAGSVARFEIFQGEPILDAKLAHTDQGFLSAVLEPGMRGVSVDIAASSGSGGFIIPNDRVDVVVTDNSQGQTNSRVLLSNVKVLAIGTRLGQTGTTGAPADPADPKSQIFTNTAIATLELSPAQADTLINATSQGKISLVLRSVADFGQTASNSPAAAPALDSNQQVKVIKFGRALNVTPGSGQQQSQAEVNTAAYVAPVVQGATTPLVTTTGPLVTTMAPTDAAPAATVTTTTTTSAPATPVFTPGGATPMTPPSVN